MYLTDDNLLAGKETHKGLPTVAGVNFVVEVLECGPSDREFWGGVGKKFRRLSSGIVIASAG